MMTMTSTSTTSKKRKAAPRRVKRASTTTATSVGASAMMKIEKHPIGWHFKGEREVPLTFSDDKLDAADVFTGFDQLPLAAREHPLTLFWRKKVLLWKIAFGVMAVGFVAMCFINIFLR